MTLTAWIETNKLHYIQKLVKRLDERFINTKPSWHAHTMYTIEFKGGFRLFNVWVQIIEQPYF